MLNVLVMVAVKYTQTFKEPRLSFYISHSESSDFNIAALSVKVYSASLLRIECKSKGPLLRFKMEVMFCLKCYILLLFMYLQFMCAHRRAIRYVRCYGKWWEGM